MSSPQSSNAAMATDQQRQDSDQLKQFGYGQELHRTMSLFSNFAVTFSYISVTTGIFALFALGLGTGGPAFIWSWPIVFFGQLLVGLVFCELGSRFPIAGSVYSWSKQVANRDVAWMGGWVYLIALIATIASVDFVVPPVIASLFGLDASNTAVLITIALIVLALTSIINIIGTRVIAFINNIGVIAEFLGMLVLGSILLFAHSNHPISFLSSTGGTEVNGSYVGTFFAAMLMSLFVVYGFDTAGTLAEETHNPSRAVPRALLLALLGSFVIGGLFLVGAVLAIPADGLAKFMADPGSLESIISDAIPGLSNVFFIIVATAITVCGLSVQANATRLLFSMARDREVPGSTLFRKVHPKLGTPIAAILATTILSAVLIFATQVESVLVAVTVVLIYLAYLICTAATLVARLRGKFIAGGSFSLGRLGLIVNAVAVVWGIAMIINLSWYRPNPANPAYLNLAIYIFVPLILVVGALYYFLVQKPMAKRAQQQDKPAA
ncbi:MAG TPA: amino acid permease [Ktedonobacterales bacterium]|jgi:urea carboxylase system permease|nr:amino acid permease [Ktedonobacterales bacterium]